MFYWQKSGLRPVGARLKATLEARAQISAYPFLAMGHVFEMDNHVVFLNSYMAAA